MSHQYDKLGSSGESSQGGGGSGVVLVVNGEERAPELEPLLAEPYRARFDHHHHHQYYDTDYDQYYHHHHHHHLHHHRPPSYYQHQNTYAPRSSIRYRKVSARSN